MTEIKQDMADKEIVRMAEERRREKLETLAAKERVKAQIQVRLKTNLLTFKFNSYRIISKRLFLRNFSKQT